MAPPERLSKPARQVDEAYNQSYTKFILHKYELRGTISTRLFVNIEDQQQIH